MSPQTLASQHVLFGDKSYHQELLGKMVQSQCGPVHLFDLCLRCGHLGMALALAAHGVPGCVLEDHHLGPFCRDSSPFLFSGRSCSCQAWDTCPYCCWAFPVDQGIWMEDWDVNLIDSSRSAGAFLAAQKAAATPLTRAMLSICSRDMDLPFSVSPKAMARLLDIAILTGNHKATVNLAKKCQVRPLRRWGMDWKFEQCWQAARTALWAGANFQDLMVKDPFLFLGYSEDVPFPQALFLKSLEDWQKIRHLFPRYHDLWRARNFYNTLGNFFLEGHHGPGGSLKLSLDKIRAAEDAGVDLQCLFVGTRCQGDSIALLDVAILCGQPDCAKSCVEGGIELKGDEESLAWHQRVLRGESLILYVAGLDLDVVPSEAQITAAAAGREWLKRCWKSESSQKGIALYQMMLKMFKGRSFPRALVHEILNFSTTVPKIIDQLDLWEHVGDWMAAICGGPFAPAAADVDGMDVKVESAGLQGPSGSEGLQQCAGTYTVGSWTGCVFANCQEFILQNYINLALPQTAIAFQVWDLSHITQI